MLRVASCITLAGTLALGACAVAPPTGPSVMAMPAQGKSFEQFQQDDAICRQFASASIGGAAPAQAATDSAVNSAAVGTLLGAAAGAAIGAAAGNPALGAAAGAGGGLLIGGASGANAAAYSGESLQRRYDMGYLQCMAAKGESVPTAAASGQAYPGAYPYPAYAYPAYPGYYYPRYYYGPPAYGSVFIGGRFR
jgi:Glycine-zipper domain